MRRPRLFIHTIGHYHNAERLSLPLSRKSARALFLASADDLVCVLDQPEPAFLDYLAELGIGPRPGNIIVLDRSAGDGLTPQALFQRNPRAVSELRVKLADTAAIDLDAFMRGQAEFELARWLEAELGRRVLLAGRADIAAVANFKPAVRAAAGRLGVPLADGEVVDSSEGFAVLEAAVRRWLPRTGRVIIRGGYSYTGRAVFTVDRGSLAEQLTVIRRRRENRHYLVEVCHRLTCSPCLLFDIGERIRFVAAADQEFQDDVEYLGNVYPSAARTLPAMIESGQRLAGWLRASGYRGPAGFDFCEYLDPATVQPRHFLAEINPRYNGSSYAWAILERLAARQHAASRPAPRAYWMTTFALTPCTFAALRRRCGQHFFPDAAGGGVIPYQCQPLWEGSCAVVVLGQDRLDVRQRLAAFQAAARSGSTAA